MSLHPAQDGAKAAIEMAWHEKVPHDQISLTRGDAEISAYDLDIVGYASESLRARLIAEFEVRDIRRDDSIEQRERLRRAMEVRFPNDGRQVRTLSHQVQDGG